MKPRSALRQRDREVRSGPPIKISENAYAQLAQLPADLTALGIAESSLCTGTDQSHGTQQRQSVSQASTIDSELERKGHLWS
jgi:hypothetical protein